MSAAAYSEQFDLGRVFLRAYDIIKRHLPLLAALVLILYGLPKIGATLMHRITGDLPFFHFFSNTTAFVYGMVAWLGFLAFQASAANVVAADLNDRTSTFGGAVRTGVRFLAPLIGLFIVSCIAVVVGFVCLVVPGLFLLTIWAVAAPAMVVERLDIGQSLSRSSSLTEGYRWYVFAIGVIFVVASSIGHSLVDHHGYFNDSHNLFATIGRTVSELLGDAMDTIFALIGAVLTMSLYYELRMLKEAAGPEELASVLE
jgi:hypothetical protein